MRRNAIATSILALAFAVGASLPAAADDASSDTEKASKEQSAEEASSSAVPVFVPPQRGAPITRVGGATRSISTLDLPTIEALVPETLGYTIEAQPTLYWYLSEDTDMRVDLTVVEGDEADPALEVTLAGPFEAGIQQIELSEHDLELETGVAYQWYVTLLPDPNQRWQGRIAGGVVVRSEPSEALQQELAAASDERRPHVLATHGVWYEAVDTLTQRIAAAPADGSLHAQRNALLEQVGLGHTATAPGNVAAP